MAGAGGREGGEAPAAVWDFTTMRAVLSVNGRQHYHTAVAAQCPSRGSGSPVVATFSVGGYARTARVVGVWWGLLDATTAPLGVVRVAKAGSVGRPGGRGL